MLYRIMIARAIPLILVRPFTLGAEVISVAGMLTPFVTKCGDFSGRQKHADGASSRIRECLESLRQPAL